MNSGLLAYYSKLQPGKLGSPSGPTRRSAKATYNKMSPAERQQLMETIASLAGLQEGLKDGFLDGTHYEYEHDPKRTVKVDPSGQVVPATLVAQPA